jgi:hypothetical protein
MALSASFDFTLDRDAIITRALRMIGATGAGQTPTADEISDGSLMLNMMLKSWMADGFQLWTLTQTSLTPVASQYKYTIGTGGDINVPRPEEIFGIFRRLTSDTTDVMLLRVAREQYWQLPNKSGTGTPTQFYYDQTDNAALGNVYIWTAPDATFASDYTLEILYQRPFDDMDSATNNLYLPQTWLLAVVYGLAALLAVEYGIPSTDRNFFIQMAEVEKRKVLDWDTEHASLFFAPNVSSNQGWYS